MHPCSSGLVPAGLRSGSIENWLQRSMWRPAAWNLPAACNIRDRSAIVFPRDDHVSGNPSRPADGAVGSSRFPHHRRFKWPKSFCPARTCFRHSSALSESASMIRICPGPCGDQRWRKRSEAAPAKMVISGVPVAAAACCPRNRSRRRDRIGDDEAKPAKEPSQKRMRSMHPEASAAAVTRTVLAACSAIDPDGAEIFAEGPDQSRFEIAVDALGFVVADAEADGCARGIAFDLARGGAM